jgi:hypothetical protein
VTDGSVRTGSTSGASRAGKTSRHTIWSHLWDDFQIISHRKEEPAAN